MNKKLESELLWIIPPQEERKPFYTFPSFPGKVHIEYYKQFYKENNLVLPSEESDFSFGIDLAQKGFVNVVNSGHAVNGKYYASFFIPEQVTENQIKFLEDIKLLLTEKYHKDILDVLIITSEKQSYTNKNYRILSMESKINHSNKDPLTLLYEEIEKQRKHNKKR